MPRCRKSQYCGIEIKSAIRLVFSSGNNENYYGCRTLFIRYEAILFTSSRKVWSRIKNITIVGIWWVLITRIISILYSNSFRSNFYFYFFLIVIISNIESCKSIAIAYWNVDINFRYPTKGQSIVVRSGPKSMENDLLARYRCCGITRRALR